MRVATVGAYPLTLGGVIAIVVVLIGILGIIGVVPLSKEVVFGLFTALGVARLT